MSIAPPRPEREAADRLDAIDRRLAGFEESLRAIERRLSALEGRAAEEASAAAEPSADSPAPSAEARAGGADGLLSLAGRSFLVLGGAFLIRAVTDAGVLSRPAGVAAGLSYAAAWLYFADRDGRRGRPSSAAFHGVAAVLIAYPLLWEASTRLGALSPSSAVAAIALATAVCLAVAWRQPGPALSWAVTVSAAATLGSLFASDGAAVPASGVLVLLAGATIWLAYGRRFAGPRWPAAIAADAAVALVAWLASRPGGPPENYRGLTPAAAIGLALALPLLCLPSFAVRTLVRRREATPFEAVQSVAALLVGFGGAVRVARSAGLGVGPLAAASLLLGLTCYGVAFGFVERRNGSARNFHLYSSFALLLALAGGAFCLPEGPLVALWGAMAVASAHLGGRYGRMTLRVHGAIYALAAAIVAGLPAAVFDAFFAPAGTAFRPVGSRGLLSLAGAAGAYAALFAARKRGIPRWQRRLPACVLAAICLAGGGALAIGALDGRAGELAAVRTAVIAASALLLAAAGSRPRLWELRWFVPPLLLLGAIKILFEDLPRGRPLTLFAGFAAYGIALLAAPRLLRDSRRGI